MIDWHLDYRVLKRTLLLAVAACVPCLSVCGWTQTDSNPLGSDDRTLRTDAVGTQHFIAAHGRRGMIAGYGSGGLEIWAYPFQILRGYRVSFHPTGATSSVNAADILSRIDYAPDSITRVYLGPNFTIREELFVPMNQPGAILTYSVESKEPIEIEVHAIPVLDLMWPAALGGQSFQWNSTLPGFVLSEPADGFTAAVGSPDIVAHDDSDNRTSRGPAQEELAFTLRPDASNTARVYIALNPPHAVDAAALLHTLVRDRASLRAEADAQVNSFRQNVLQIQTPDARVNQAIAWSEIALSQAWVCNPDLGCGFVAGYGPSRGARRPQYDWFFAGDGLTAADASISAGDYAHARDELAFILRYQDRKTGMIWHELSQSAGLIDWTGKFPYMFVHVDITFQFLGTISRYATASGDADFIRENWPAIESAYRYCQTVIDPETALPRIPTDKEGGDEQDRMSDDLGLSTSWVTASSGVAQLAKLAGHADVTDDALKANQRARDSIQSRYWSAGESFWISGHSQSGQAMTDRRSGPAEAITLGLFTPQQNTLLLNELASASFQTDWGTRGIGAGSSGFDPESYAKGSVWPVGTAALASAFWSEHRPVTALALWNSLLPLTRLDSLGHIPEVLAGNLYRPQSESVPEQTWSSAGFLQATIDGLLGLQENSANDQLVFAPKLPPTWNDLSVTHIRLAKREISLALHRASGELNLQIENSGQPFQLEFAPALPLGAKLGHAQFNQRPLLVKLDNHPQDTSAKAVVTVPHGKVNLRLMYEGGVSVIPNEPHPLRGDASVGVRIINVHLDGTILSIDADVPADRTSSLRLQTQWKLTSQDGANLRQVSASIDELSFAAMPDAHGSYRHAHATLRITP